MKLHPAARLLLAGALLAALALRLPRLDLRPMHTDEAVQAAKTGALFEHGEYRYDPQEYHGPTLYYFTLPGLWLTGTKTFSESSEGHYRGVTVFFGVALVLLAWFMRDALSSSGAVIAAILTAVSPAFVFYSRYYIQEMLLVFFTFACVAALWRWLRSGKLSWAVWCGAFAGLMHATKETCVFAFAATAMALAITAFVFRGRLPAFKITLRQVAVVIVVALAVSVLFFSSFFTHAAGPLDSIRTYFNYAGKSVGAGEHDHPWHWYFSLLLAHKSGSNSPFFSEGLILLMALIGLVCAAFTARKKLDADDDARWRGAFLVFLSVFTLLLAAMYSAVPYKTPWCLLSFHLGFIWLSGAGGAWIFAKLREWKLCFFVAPLFFVGACHLARQAYLASFPFSSADCKNPYVYAQTLPDLRRLAERVDEIRPFCDPKEWHVNVIAETDNYWPLPWYLRKMPAGFWNAAPEQPDAPVVVLSPTLSDAVRPKLKDRYQSSLYGLRPGVFLELLIREDLWQAKMKAK